MFSYSCVYKEVTTLDIKTARKRARYSQQETADYLGVSRPTYIKMENDPGTITVDDAKKLAAFFGVKVSDIFFASNYS